MIGVYMEGGLCNRLFQLAFAFSFAKKNVLNFKIEGWKVNTHHSIQIYEWLISRFMELPNYEKKTLIYYREQFKEFYNEYSDYCPPNINRYSDIFIRGFFQNENYFIEYKDEILELFKAPDAITLQIQNSKYKEYLDNAYFLHIRLGDYVNDHGKHWIDLTNYYINALSQIPEKSATILVFSNFPNDIEKYYPKIIPYFENRNVIIVNEDDEVFNLYLMSSCKKGGICANSSFSWWGSWLNKNEEKKVFMPKKWLNGFDNPSNIHPSYATVLEL
jgi:hypothetical protein